VLFQGIRWCDVWIPRLERARHQCVGSWSLPQILKGSQTGCQISKSLHIHHHNLVPSLILWSRITSTFTWTFQTATMYKSLPDRHHNCASRRVRSVQKIYVIWASSMKAECLILAVHACFDQHHRMVRWRAWNWLSPTTFEFSLVFIRKVICRLTISTVSRICLYSQ